MPAAAERRDAAPLPAVGERAPGRRLGLGLGLSAAAGAGAGGQRLGEERGAAGGRLQLQLQLCLGRWHARVRRARPAARPPPPVSAAGLQGEPGGAAPGWAEPSLCRAPRRRKQKAGGRAGLRGLWAGG